MISATSALKAAMYNNLMWKAHAFVTLGDGSTITLDPTDFTVSGNSMYDGAPGFPLGAAIAKTIKLTILGGEYNNIDWYGAKIALEAKTMVAGTVSTVKLGTYTVITPASYGGTISITGADDMYRADIPYPSGGVFPATLEELFRRACTAAGIPFTTTTFTNSTYEVQREPEGDMTCRQMLGYIAMIAGGNARINRDGNCVIQSWAFPSVDTSGTTVSAPTGGVKLDSFTGNIHVHTDDITITGLSAVERHTETATDGTTTETDVTVTNGTDGYVLALSNPLFQQDTAACLALIAAKVKNKTFRIFEGQHIANPLVEFMDKAVIKDRAGDYHNTVITNASFTFNGLSEFANGADVPLMRQSSYSSAAATALQAAEALVHKERTAREAAQEALRQAMTDTSGLYETGGNGGVRYLHNKPALAESDVVIKITASGVGVSSDGGNTYPYGFTINGSMITNILSTEGINADWITSGVIDSADGRFSIDLTNGCITINGSGGTTLLQYTRNSGLVINGTISGSTITGGTISGATINGGTISGATIEGLDLVLGGRNNADGTLVVKNRNGNTVVTLNNQGIAATAGTFSGELSSPTGTIGGWTIGSNRLYTDDMNLDASNGRLEVGNLIFGSPYYTLGEGIFSTDDTIIIAPDAPGGNGTVVIEGDVSVWGEISATEPLPIGSGGTGATNYIEACANLHIPYIETDNGTTYVNFSNSNYATGSVSFSEHFGETPAVMLTARHNSNVGVSVKLLTKSSSGFTFSATLSQTGNILVAVDWLAMRFGGVG